jgi:ABC-2 type transport system permease protein
MLSLLLRFENRYHSRQLSFRAAAILFFLLGILAVGGSYGGDAVYKNSPYAITVIVSLLSLFSVLVSTLLCANVVLRDATYQMDALVLTSSIRRFSYFGSRFGGLLLAVFGLLCLAVIGLLIGTFLIDSVRRGPLNPTHYVWPLLVFGLPNLLFSSSLIFSVAILSRSSRAVYAAGVLIYVLYLLASILGNSPLMASSTLSANESDWLPFLIDPFGLAPFFGETRHWTINQRNHQLFALSGLFGINRLLWSGISALVLLISYRFFSFGQQQVTQSKTGTSESELKPLLPSRYQKYNVTPGTLTHTGMALWTQLRLEITSVFGQYPVWFLLFLWAFLMGVDVKESIVNGWFGIDFYPTTGLIVEQLRSIRPAMVLLIFWGGELLWRERSGNRQAIIFSTPVAGVVFIGAKLITLALLIAAIITVNIGIGLGLQLALGYSVHELPVFLSLFYYSGLPLLLFAVLILFIQTLCPNKYLGMLISLVVAGGLAFSRQLGVEHYLLRYATVPEMYYSEMNGFGHYQTAFNWYMLYWGFFAIMLIIIAIGFWPTGQRSAVQRIKAVGQQLGKSGRWVFVGASILWFLAGGFIYYQTNIIGTYQSRAARLDWQLRYEQRYKRFARLDQPIITAVKTQVDLFPETGKYRVKGRYQFQNKSKKPIRRIWVSIDPEVSSIQLEMAGVLKKTHDPVFDQYWFDLEKPLLPGEARTMRFSMEVVGSGFMPFNNENSVVENGSYIELEKYVPFFGYNPRLESGDEIVRRKMRLGRRGIIESSADQHLIDLQMTVSTAVDQQVVTVGQLQKSWISHNRRYFTYKTSQPIGFMFALSSARYSVRQETYKGIALRLYYQSGQTANLNVMMQAMKDAFDYGGKNFSSYPLSYYTLAEILQYKGSATAYPGLMFSRENLNFLTDFRNQQRVNYAYATVAHEVAHQWWANELNPVDSPGYQLLTESLAKYSEAMIMEKRYGKMYLRPYFLADNAYYFGSRNQSSTELPLVITEDQPFVSYQKGGLVMYRLREILGEEKVNQALRDLLAEHAYPKPKAAANDLIRALVRSASAAQNRLIEDCFRKVVTHRLAIKIVSCQQMANGRFSLTVKVMSTKMGQRADGKSIVVPSDDDWDIAVFDQPSDQWNPASKPVYCQKHHFSKPVSIIRLVVDKKPKAVAIDPYGYGLDESPEDNLAEIN